MVIPDLSVAENLHKPHAALDQSSGDQAAGAVVAGDLLVDAVHFFRGLRFARDVERLPRRHLHARGQAVTFHARLEVVLAGMLLEMLAVQPVEQAKLLLLRRTLQVPRRVEVENAGRDRPHHRTLIDGRQLAVGPILSANQRQAAGVGQCHVCRQFLRLAAKRAGEPAAQHGASAGGPPGAERVIGRDVIIGTGVHRPDQRDFVGHPAQVRHQFGQLHAALAVRLKSPKRRHDLAAGLRRVVELYVAREGLTVVLDQFRLRVEKVDLTRATEHEHRDHRLGPGLVVRLFR